jgi:hypothetical protein
VRLSSLDTSTINFPIVRASDNGWKWVWSRLWNENRQGKPKYSEKTCHSATLSTTIPTWPDLGSNPGRCDGKPANSRLSYGTALMLPCKTPNNCFLMFHCRLEETTHLKFPCKTPDNLLICDCVTSDTYWLTYPSTRQENCLRRLEMVTLWYYLVRLQINTYWW